MLTFYCALILFLMILLKAAERGERTDDHLSFKCPADSLNIKPISQLRFDYDTTTTKNWRFFARVKSRARYTSCVVVS